MFKKINAAYRPLLILVLVAGIAMLLLLFFERQILKDTWQALTNARPQYVLLLPVLLAINYFFVGSYYQHMFANFNMKISLARSWGVVSAMNFVNQILPSGGLSGITYIAYGFRATLDSGKATLVQIGRYLFAFLGYAALLPIAILLLKTENNLDKTVNLVEDAGSQPGTLIIALLFVIFVILLFTFILHQAKSNTLMLKIASLINLITKPFRRHKGKLITDATAIKLVDDFHQGIRYMRSHKRKMIIPALSMLISVLGDVAIVYFALLAVNIEVSLGIIFISFVAANIVGVVSVIPGDVGAHEAVMILVLAAFGVPEAAAISATLLYRVFNKIISLPIGFYFYTLFLKPAESGKPSNG